MENELISVIIPTYNYGHFISDAIQSIINQTYTYWEIIVVDDGSTDNTQAVVANFCNRYSNVYHVKQDNAGPSAARNNGLRHCKGNYIQFLDADDLIEEYKFEEQLQLFKQKPDVDIVYGSVRYFTRNAFDMTDRLLTYWGPNEEWMPKLTGRGHDILPSALKGNFSHLSSVLFKKQIINKVGFFDEGLRIAEDYQFLLRCAVADAYFYYDDKPGTYSLVRWHQDNVSKDIKRMRMGECEMRKKIIPLLQDNPIALENNGNAIKAITLMLSTSWKKHLLSGGKLDPIKKLIKAVGLEKVFLKIFYK